MTLGPDLHLLVILGQKRKTIIRIGNKRMRERIYPADKLLILIFYLSIRSNHSDVVELVRSTMSWGYTSILMR